MNTHSTADNAAGVSLRIRSAAQGDAALICAFVRELAEYEHLANECRLTPETAFEHILGPDRMADALIAEFEGVPAGFAVYYRTLSTFAARPGIFLEDLFVRPAFRRRGIGQALLREVGRVAHRAGAGRLEWTALKWNTGALDLYQTVGAREMKEWVLLRMDAESLARFADDRSTMP